VLKKLLCLIVFSLLIVGLLSVVEYKQAKITDCKEYKYRDYFISVLRTQSKSTFRVLKSGRIIYEEENQGTYFLEDDLATNRLPCIGKDITGRGFPVLVIAHWIGDAHGTTKYELFCIGNEFYKIQETAWGPPGTFCDIDADGSVDIVVRDNVFEYWDGCSYAESPLPTVILSYSDQQKLFYPNAKLMYVQPPGKDTIEEAASVFRQKSDWKKKSVPPTAMIQEFLRLLYGGNPEIAWQLFDMSWPEGIEGKEDYGDFLKKTLNQSQFWPIIQKQIANTNRAGHV